MSGALIVKTFFIFSAMPTEMMGNMPLELLMLSGKVLVSTLTQNFGQWLPSTFLSNPERERA